MTVLLLLEGFGMPKECSAAVILWQPKSIFFLILIPFVFSPLLLVNWYSCFNVANNSIIDTQISSSQLTVAAELDDSQLVSESHFAAAAAAAGGAVAESCDLSRGKWIPDSNPPLYTNVTCKFIQPFQNCIKNGKQDTGYLHWRWKPQDCELERFDALLFLKIMRGKKVVFIGDSLARNHIQSLVCSLSQVEEAKIIYSREDKDVKWTFSSFNFTLAILWAPFLVQHAKLQDHPSLVFKIYLDVPSPVWMSVLPEYDVAVISCGQWFFRPSIYYLNNTIIGRNEFVSSSASNLSDIGFMSAFRTAIATSLDSVAKLSKFKGLVILRTVSVEHFENGTWSSGGSCTREGPFTNQTIPLSWMPRMLNKIQVEEFDKAGATRLGSRLRLMNVTHSVYLRPDGHPGPYRLFQPFQNNKSKLLQNDCLHWCLPGPVDMWNQFILEIFKQFYY